MPPDALRLDINEQVLAGKPAQAAATIAELAALGVGISLDDFGTGYSSLAQLTRLGISEVKLDPALVSGLPNCSEKTMTVKSLVRLAQSLGIRSIGEGVETTGTAAALRVMGCDGAQGWHFARPMEASMATAWLFEQRAREAGGRVRRWRSACLVRRSLPVRSSSGGTPVSPSSRPASWPTSLIRLPRRRTGDLGRPSQQSTAAGSARIRRPSTSTRQVSAAAYQPGRSGLPARPAGQRWLAALRRPARLHGTPVRLRPVAIRPRIAFGWVAVAA